MLTQPEDNATNDVSSNSSQHDEADGLTTTSAVISQVIPNSMTLSESKKEITCNDDESQNQITSKPERKEMDDTVDKDGRKTLVDHIINRSSMVRSFQISELIIKETDEILVDCCVTNNN